MFNQTKVDLRRIGITPIITGCFMGGTTLNGLPIPSALRSVICAGPTALLHVTSPYELHWDIMSSWSMSVWCCNVGVYIVEKRID